MKTIYVKTYKWVCKNYGYRSHTGWINFDNPKDNEYTYLVSDIFEGIKLNIRYK